MAKGYGEDYTATPCCSLSRIWDRACRVLKWITWIIANLVGLFNYDCKLFLLQKSERVYRHHQEINKMYKLYGSWDDEQLKMEYYRLIQSDNETGSLSKSFTHWLSMVGIIVLVLYEANKSISYSQAGVMQIDVDKVMDSAFLLAAMVIALYAALTFIKGVHDNRQAQIRRNLFIIKDLLESREHQRDGN